MTKQISFFMDGQRVTAEPGESIWDVSRRLGRTIPHLCHKDHKDYRADGNCRACVVEIDGERVLAPSCRRQPEADMKVVTDSPRADKARKMVVELLLADQPDRAHAHDENSKLWQWAERMDLTESRFPQRSTKPDCDSSHPAMTVQLDSCIHCNLCVRACREIQVNDVIGMAGRGADARIVFDLEDAMGSSTCVACGECVEACPTGALLPARKQQFDDTTVNSLCPYCGVGCQMTYHVKDGHIQRVEGRDGPANHSRLCVKGRFGFDYIQHPGRLTKPLIRKPGTVKGLSENPMDNFREAGWDEALQCASGGLKSIRDEFGRYALAGFGSAKCSNEEAYLFQKLVRQGFGSNNVDHCTRLCHASSVAALMEGMNSGAVTAPFTAALDADVMIVIGARPASNHPVAASFIKNAAKSGKTLIVIDPRGQGLVRHADYHLQFTPGRDVALLNAIIHTIIEEDLINKDFITNRTTGFDDIKRHVKNFSPEKMSAICGIDAVTIRTVARTYATANRSIIFWGMGISQHVHGTENARALITLAMITGHIGRPGTGLHPLRGQNNVQGASDAGLIPIVYPDYKSVEDDAVRKIYEDLWGVELDNKTGLTVVEIMAAIHGDDIKGMYILGENPAMSDPDVSHARAALAKLNHLVVQDLFMTETAQYADVILPAMAFPEKTGTFTNTNRQVQMARKVVDGPDGTRPDWWITLAIANGMGLNWHYDGPEDVFLEMKKTMRSLDHITWQRLDDEGAVTYPCPGDDVPGDDILFGKSFPTKDGRAKLVPAKSIAPDEMPDDDYPYILTTGRLLEHWHTGAMTRRAETLSSLEPVATVSMHPETLKKMDIEPGDMIAVASRRGRVELRTRIQPEVPEGMVFIPFCFTEAAANLLTNPNLDPFGKIPEFKFCAVRVEKI